VEISRFLHLLRLLFFLKKEAFFKEKPETSNAALKRLKTSQ